MLQLSTYYFKPVMNWNQEKSLFLTLEKQLWELITSKTYEFSGF
jgi:hypothetical protein